MFSKKIKISCFNLKKRNNQRIKKLFFEILQKKNSSLRVIDTFSNKYQYSYNKKKISKFKKYKSISIFGLGGSSLCIKAIYDFLGLKIRKKVYFYDNLDFHFTKGFLSASYRHLVVLNVHFRSIFRIYARSYHHVHVI